TPSSATARAPRAAPTPSSSAAGVAPSAAATSANRASEMLPSPASSCARNRTDTPLRADSSRRAIPRCSRSVFTRAPTEASRVGATLARVSFIYLARQPIKSSPRGRGAPPSFETPPSRYHHWSLAVDGDVATLKMHVDPDHPHRPGYELKLNSYDLSVDI